MLICSTPIFTCTTNNTPCSLKATTVPSVPGGRRRERIEQLLEKTRLVCLESVFASLPYCHFLLGITTCDSPFNSRIMGMLSPSVYIPTLYERQYIQCGALQYLGMLLTELVLSTTHISLPDAHALSCRSIFFLPYFPKIALVMNHNDVQRITKESNTVRGHCACECCTNILLDLF